MSRQGAAPGPDPHPGRQPDDRRGADPARRGDARPAGRRAVRARASSRCPRGCRCPRARPAPGTPGGSSSASSTTRPDGTTIHPIVRIGRHAAEGIIEASAEQEADLIIFGWGGKAAGGRDGTGPTVFSPTIDEVVRDSPCDIAVVKQRGSDGDPARSSSRSAAARTPSSRSATRTRSPATTTRRSSSSTSSRRGSPSRSAPRPSGRWPRSSSSTSAAAARRSCARRRTSATRSCARPRRPTWWSWARRRQPGGADGETYLFGALPEAIAARAKPTVIVVKTRETIERATFEQLAARAETLAAADRAAEEARAVPVRVERWFGESNFHHAEFADLRRLVDAQGEAAPDDQPRPADAQRGGDDRADRPPGDARDGRPGAAARRGPRHRLGVDRPDARDRRGRGRPRRPAPRRPAPLRLVRGQGRGALEVGLRDHRRHHRVGRHGRPELAPADGLRDARAAAPRAAPAVRQGLLPAPDRRGRRPQGGRRRPGHRARRAAAHQPVLPGAVGDDPAAGGRVRRADGRCSSRSRSSPATRSRSATSSTPPSGSASRASARSTSSGGSIATRSSRACRGCRSSSSRRS